MLRAAYHDAAFPVPDGAGLTVTEVARPPRRHGQAVSCTAASADCLNAGLLGNPVVTTEMGRAMLRLAQTQLGAGDVDAV